MRVPPDRKTVFGHRARAAPRKLVTAALLVVAAVVARDARAEFQVFTTADGLAGDGVRVMLEDRDGNLWFGTEQSGLSRYDGFRWATFGSSSGLPGSRVFDLIETSSGEVWAATSGGVARWDDSAWHAYGVPDGLPSGNVRQLLEDAEGMVWILIEGLGVARFDGATWTRYTTANGLVDDRVNDMILAQDGSLWFATPTGVSRLVGTTWFTFTTADGLANNNVSSLLETASGSVWFATQLGLSRRVGSQWTTFTTADGLARDQVDVLIEDDLGRVWAGTTTGVSRYDGTAWTTFTTTHGLADNVVDVAFKDARGQLWFGFQFSTRGVSRWDGSAFERFTTVDGIAANHVSDFLQDRRGNLWLASGFPGAGVTRFDGAFVRSWGPPDVANPLVLACEADTGGVMWIGTANGLNRFDGRQWRLFTTFEGLPSNTVNAILEDRTGLLWFGTNGGLATRTGSAFTPVTAVSDTVTSLFEDSGGRIWAGTRSTGAYRFDGSSWTNFRLTDGLASNQVRAIGQAQGGAMWFGTPAGASRYDGVAWTTFTTADGLAGDLVHAAARDSTGPLWFGTEEGASRFDGSSWQSYTENDGLASRAVLAVHVSADGVRWFCTSAGASRFDGTRFLTFGPSAGLAGSQVRAATSDARGRLWFGTLGGVSRLEPDRVAPRGLVIPEPQLVSPSRTQTISFLAAFGERGVAFSHSFDGEPFSPFEPEVFVVRSGLLDGTHTFTVRAMDEFGNVQQPPTTVAFEVDATPPGPVLTSPTFSQAIQGQAAVTGTASDPRFEGFVVEVQPEGAAFPDTLVVSLTPVVDDTLATWDTRTAPDGVYDLRLVVSDAIGLSGTAQIRVTVDNEFPFADQTAPVSVVAATGGDVFTTNQELHLFFPPNAFDRDAVVRLTRVGPAGVPANPSPGTVRLTSEFDLDWAAPGGGDDPVLRKPATLEFSYAGLTPPPGSTPALYALGIDSTWSRVGGTVDAVGAKVRATIDGRARLALFTESSVPSGARKLSALALTPRVFSPRGSFSNTRIAIGFSLGQAAPVTVKVYNRAGRLIREVASSQSMGPGANLVYWDGRNRDGDFASEGLYVVTVEALDDKRSQTLAVVR